MFCNWQLESLGNVINIKNHQIMELKMVEFDAKNSRMAAKKELNEVGETFDSWLQACFASFNMHA